MKECPKCKACYDTTAMRCSFDTCDLIETVPCSCTIATKYRIHSRLGEGRLGAVYRATQLSTQNTVTIKLMLPYNISNKSQAANFRRLASAASQLHHNNIIPVIDFGTIETSEIILNYLVMEAVDGWPLSMLIRDQKRLTVPRVVAVIDNICAALEYAHEKGVTHGGLKPPNIWLSSEGISEETYKLLDFGFAFTSNEPFSREITGFMDPDAETRALQYLSPEQCADKPPDARSDVYSLGVVAYEMLSGAPPFTGTAEQLKRKQQRSRPRSLWLWHRIPRKISRVIHKALAKNPRRRYQSVKEFNEALRRAMVVKRLAVLPSKT
ncbi:MAG: serine/threonine-protein kinase [Acidobacteriota bacterium]